MMTKEQELMNFLHQKIFAPILSSPSVPAKIKSGVNFTIARMNELSSEKMVQYFWFALATENVIVFSKQMKAEGLTRFEDVMEGFRKEFNDSWIKGR